MVVGKKRVIGWCLTAALALAVLASPGVARAQEASGCKEDRTVSVASRFLTTNGWDEKNCKPEFNLVGNLVVWGLILTSVIAVALIIQAGLKARRSEMVPPETIAAVEQLLNEKKYSEAKELVASDPSLFGQLMKAAFNQATHGFSVMQEAINDTGSFLSAAQIRAIEVLNVLGAVGPMAGLFGTVYGMIESFFKIANAGGAPKPAELATGISTALVCTFWGLIVAVPSIIAYGLFRSKIEGHTDEAMSKAVELISVFRPGKKPAAPTPGGPGRPAPATPQPTAQPATM